MYTSGMKQKVIQRLKNVTGFKVGSFPFKYLGVPINFKRISVKECMNLVEKITSRLRSWSSRNLAYQGRLVLVNSVLLSIQVYWSQVFTIPKRVLNEVESICRAFLWTGEYYNGKPCYVAWSKVCLPKYGGGLGIRQISIWNIAAMGRYVWVIASKKDNLWIKWVNEVYVKHHNWWDYQPSVGSSWYWRKVCSVKDSLKEKIPEITLRQMN